MNSELNIISCKCGRQYNIATLKNISSINICLFCHPIHTKEYKIDIQSNKNLTKMSQTKTRLLEKNKNQKNK